MLERRGPKDEQGKFESYKPIDMGNQVEHQQEFGPQRASKLSILSKNHDKGRKEAPIISESRMSLQSHHAKLTN